MTNLMKSYLGKYFFDAIAFKTFQIMNNNNTPQILIEQSAGSEITLRGDTVKHWQLVSMLMAAPQMKQILEETRLHFITKNGFVTEGEQWLLEQIETVLAQTKKAIRVRNVCDIGAGHWCADITLQYSVAGVTGLQHTHFVWSHRGKPEQDSLENALNTLLHTHGLYGALQLVREDDCLVQEVQQEDVHEVCL